MFVIVSSAYLKGIKDDLMYVIETQGTIMATFADIQSNDAKILAAVQGLIKLAHDNTAALNDLKAGADPNMQAKLDALATEQQSTLDSITAEITADGTPVQPAPPADGTDPNTPA